MPDDYEKLAARRDGIVARQHERIAAIIVRDVAELPDRTSPDDRPDMMLVSDHELKAIVLAALANT